MCKAAWIAAITLRCFAADSCFLGTHKKSHLGLFLLLTIPCEVLLLAFAVAGADVYDYAWRGYSLLQVSAMFLVARGEYRNPPIERWWLAFVLTVIFAMVQHHERVWPGYWLEPVFLVISWSYCFLGLVLAVRRPPTGVSVVLAAWLLLTAALYSGCAISINRAGIATELLNCCAFAALISVNWKGRRIA